MWGFITSLNDVLIPYLQNAYSLSHFAANIVQFAFFIAYFLGSLVFFLCSRTGNDPISVWGYQKTLVIGLLIGSIACFLFAMSAYYHLQFGYFLAALFVLGLGLTFLQIAANPFVAVIGSPDTASSRLNLSQAFNSLGTTLGPAIGGYLIFANFTKDSNDVSAVIVPYLFLSALLLLLSAFIYWSKINDKMETSNAQNATSSSIFQRKYVILGALGIFFYVGAEVAIGSNLVSFLRSTAAMSETLAASFLSYYWGGAMIGRFLGSISLSKMAKNKKLLFMLLLAVAGFSVIFAINYSLHHLTFAQVSLFLCFMLLNFLCFFIGKSRPARTLAVFSLANAVLILCSITMKGDFSVWALLSIGLFNSIMWSNIFTLAIAKLDKTQTATASSILIMMILGGAVLPPLQGLLTDLTGNIRLSFIVPLISYIYLLYYGVRGYRLGLEK
jgi:FHS family L-fucose permease-like MFS transporter